MRKHYSEKTIPLSPHNTHMNNHADVRLWLWVTVKGKQRHGTPGAGLEPDSLDCVIWGRDLPTPCLSFLICRKGYLLVPTS